MIVSTARGMRFAGLFLVASGLVLGSHASGVAQSLQSDPTPLDSLTHYGTQITLKPVDPDLAKKAEAELLEAEAADRAAAEAEAAEQGNASPESDATEGEGETADAGAAEADVQAEQDAEADAAKARTSTPGSWRRVNSSGS